MSVNEDHLIHMMELDDKISKIRFQINSKLDNQKQLALVLQAIEDNIKEQKQNTTPVAYFVSFLSLLDQCCTNDEIKDLNLASNAIYFLDLVSPYTPSKLLKSKFSDILTRLAPALTNEEADAPLIRSSIGFLESLLLSQDRNSWNNVNNYKISPKRGLSVILELSLDPRPKVRKRAQEAVNKILSAVPAGPTLEHPAAGYAGEFALNNLITLIQENKPSKKSASKEANAEVIHNLQLITFITKANAWPLKQITPLCDVLLEICKTADQFLVSAVFNAFEGMFQSMTNEIDGDKFAQVLNIISELKPALNDPHLAPSWLAVIAKSIISFSNNIDSLKSLSKFPDIFTIVGEYFNSEVPNICISASQCLIAITVEAFKDKELLLPPLIKPEIYEKVDDIITKISEITFSFLSVKFRHCASDVCELISTLFIKIRQRANPEFLQHLQLVGEWRSSEQEGFELNDISEKVIASAITAVGPEAVLQALPLNLTDSNKIGRAWLLPILRDNVKMAHLSFYIKNILPNVQFFEEKIQSDDFSSMNVKIFGTIVDQIWSLLPHFCYLPTDIESGFTDEFAAHLSTLLYESVQLRPIICNSLKNIIISEKQRADEISNDIILNQQFPSSKAITDLEYLANTKANKLLSVLFNVFTQTPMDQRNYVLETIESYLTVSKNEDLIATFNKVCTILRKALDDENEEDLIKNDDPLGKSKIPKLSITMMDLIVLMAKYIPVDCHNALLTIFNETVRISDVQIQKRSYRILTKLSETEKGVESILTLIDNVLQVLIETTDSTLAAAKPQRLECMLQLIKLLSVDHLHFIPAVLSEIIISSKSVNEKTRTSSYNILVEMGKKMSDKRGTLVRNSINDPDMPDSEASLQEFFTMCSAGLVGTTPHMVSAAVTALSCIFFEFHNQLDIDYQKELVSTIELFFASKSREIIKPTLGFIKVAILCMPEEVIIPGLKGLLTNLMEVNTEQKNHFKSKIKHLIERMIRKFGFDLIDQSMPEEDKKLMNSIRKSKARAKRKAVSAVEGDNGEEENSNKSAVISAYDKAIYEDSDSEYSDSEDEENRYQKGRGKNNKRTEQYISESKDTPLDLLDKQTLSHISSSRPKKFNKRSLEKLSEFKTKDGKLVIREDDETNDDILSSKNSIDAYVEAVRQGPIRGQRNRLKYKKVEGDGIDWDDEPKKGHRSSNNGEIDDFGGGGEGGRGGRNGRGGRGGGRGNDRGIRGGFRNGRRSKITKPEFKSRKKF